MKGLCDLHLLYESLARPNSLYVSQRVVCIAVTSASFFLLVASWGNIKTGVWRYEVLFHFSTEIVFFFNLCEFWSQDMSTPVAATVFVGAQSSLGASGNLSTVPFQCVSHRYMVSTAQFQAQQQQFSECRGYTYYSPLSLDNMPSPSNTAYALSTPPFSSPIQQLK